jgi:hypothetical protein
MLSKAGVKLLKTIYEALPESLHLREISRRARVSSETAHRLLHDMAKEDVLFFEERGKEKIFSLNLSNPFVPKYYEFIKGKQAKDLFSGNTKIKVVRDDILSSVESRTERKFSILLMSTDPFKIFLVVANEDYSSMVDAVENLQGNLKLKFSNLSLVAMSEDGLKNNLDQYPEMREVIKKTTPLHGSENFFRLLFEYWREKDAEIRSSKGVEQDKTSDEQVEDQPQVE